MLDFMNQRLLPDPYVADSSCVPFFLMRIDQRAILPNLAVAFASFFTLGLLLLAVFHGQPLEIIDSQSIFFLNSSPPARSFYVDHLGPHFLYLVLECSFSSAVRRQRPVHFDICIESPIGTAIYRSSYRYNITFSGAGITHPVILFYDRISSCHSYNSTVRILSNVTDFSGMSVSLRRGNPAICASMISIKLSGCVFIVTIVLYFLYQLYCAREALRVTAEQKLTAILTVLCFFSDDPFSGLFVHHPAFLMIALRLIIASFFRVFLRYYVAFLFESVRRQRCTGTTVRDWALLAFFGGVAAVDVVTALAHELDLLHGRFQRRDPVLARYITELATDGAVAVCAIAAYAALDSAESFRFAVYTAHFSLWLLIVTVISHFRAFSVVNELNPVLMLAEFLAQNYFVGMMNFVHGAVQDGKAYANPSSALNHMIIESAEEYEESEEKAG
jgi:hypothetical protein